MHEEERAELLAVAERTAAGASTAVIVYGEPGIGKTTLLNGVPATIRIGGIEAEAALPYAALDRLLRLARIEALPHVLRDLVTRPEEDPYLVGLAIVTLLSGLAPVTVVIDDAHRLDRQSTEALLFAARRLDADGIAMIFAAEHGCDAPGLRALAVDRSARAAGLLDGIELNPQVKVRLLQEADGNPLALLEFARALTAEQRLGQVLPVSVLPASNAVLARFGHRLATAVPYESRLLLTLAAAERDGDLATVMSAAAALGLSERDLAGAEGALRVSGIRLAFRHPLERSAAYYLVPLTDRLRVHRVLAEMSADPIRRLGHLTAATLTPDEQVAAELEDLARRADPALAACMLDHAAQISPVPAERTRRSSEAARNLLRSDDYERALPRLAGRASVRDALLAGDEQAALALATNQIDQLRERGTLGELPGILGLLAQAQIAAGQYGEARAALDEAAEIAGATGGSEPSAELLAEIAAIQGDASGQPGLLALGRGRYEEALPHLQAAWRARPEAMTVAADLVEAAVRAGRPELAAEPLDRLTAWARAGGRPWAQAVALRARALVSPAEEAGELLARAVHLHEGAGRPFERARTALLFGQWLRRAGRKADSRQPLQLAAEQFARLGATPWAERARGELRAAGAPAMTAVSPDEDPLGGLTPQERRIVRLAAAGVSNREIAAQLFLSTRTVEYHLYRAYPKLGVNSRQDLRRKISRRSS
ncbi:helix-turn-helix transcriptional regulator [Nonomuraea rhodomycinica]|uniref:AAA family ATPase n=1 Tax=Nonomuraea rhodomycinica TaxID=1712872 RepID=A0A7Y6IS02_9ACTN|nr:LuxR family transcriptional regulator [Nonomuraea rhodomycinica]NUW43342.1 AAA family ATPase [Nonomuraea rhodomycinica]